MEMIDVQCFAGGLTLGVAQAGFTLVGKREAPPDPGFGTPLLEGNRHLLGDAWYAQTGDSSSWDAKHVPLVISNPPCSGFSNMTGINKDFHGIDSAVNECMWETIRFASRCDPEIVIFESVQGAYSSGRPLMQRLRLELESLTGKDYDLYHVKHNVASLGGGCVRRRYFFVAVRSGLNFDVAYPDPERVKVKTLAESIGDLLDTPLSWDSTPGDGHVTTLSGLNGRRFKRMAELMPYWRGGSSLSDAAWRYLNGVPEEGLPGHDCLPEECGFSANQEKKLREIGSWFFFQPQRWAWDVPGRVIDGGSFARSVHPLLPRTFTYREGARIMGFPDEWSLKPIGEHKGGPAWLGKGVCPTAGKWIGHAARKTLLGRWEAPGGELIGERERLIWVK